MFSKYDAKFRPQHFHYIIFSKVISFACTLAIKILALFVKYLYQTMVDSNLNFARFRSRSEPKCTTKDYYPKSSQGYQVGPASADMGKMKAKLTF